jgi:hypothetical protein
VTTIAGQASAGYLNGVGTNATFTSPLSITADTSGNLYVGESYDIRQIYLSTLIVIRWAGTGVTGTANGAGTNATMSLVQGLAYSNGFLYISDKTNNLIRKANLYNLAITTQAGVTGAGRVNGVGTNSSFSAPSGIVVDNSGNLIIADATNNLIRKNNIATAMTTTIAGGGAAVPTPISGFVNGTGYNALFSAPYVSSDTSGNVFISDSNVVRTGPMTTSVITTLAGGLGYTTSGFANGTGTSATFSGNRGSCTDNSGNLFICDTTNYSIRQLVIATGAVTTLAGTGSSGSADATGTNASFNQPNAICYDGAGNLFVADASNNKIRQIVISTGVVTTLAGSGSSGYSNATGTNATFTNPQGIMIDTSGNLFVCDTTDIRKIVISTAAVTTLAGQTISGSGNGTGTNATFNGVNTGTYYNGSLFVCDATNYLIRQIVISSATVTTLIGTTGTSGRADGVGTNATIGTSATICPDGSGNLFFGDQGNRRIRMINIATASVATFAGGGGSNAAGYSDGSSSYQYALFNQPYCIVPDTSGNLYMNEYTGQVVRVLSNGIVTTLAGNGVSALRDDIGRAAQFNNMTQITTDNSGSLYVSELTNHTIRKITIATGEVKTIVGSCPRTAGSTNGVYTAASFSGPTSCCLDDSGNLFVADKTNNLIRKIVLATSVVTTLAGGLSGGTTAGFLNGVGTNASFSGPTDIKYNSGYLYVADATTNLVRQITIATGNVTTVAGGSGTWTANTSIGGYSDGTGVGVLTYLGAQNNAFNDYSGNIYIFDYGNRVIRKVNTTTAVVTTIAGRALTPSYSFDGVGTNAAFYPYSGTCDTSGNVYFFDLNYFIRKLVLATGEITTFMGNGLSTPFTPSGSGINFNCGSVSPCAIDTSGNMYAIVTTPGNSAFGTMVYKIVLATATATVIAGTVTGGSANGIGTNATFTNINSLALDGSGNLYVSESTPAHTLRKIVLSTGVVTTLAGQYNSSAYVNAVGTNARFSYPSGIVYYQGSLFISDYNNRRLRQLDLSTANVTTLAGNSSLSGILNGVGTNASFATITIAPVLDYSGNLYLSENSVLRRINIATATVSIFVGGIGGTTAGRSNASSYLAAFNGPASLAVGSNALYVADPTNNSIRMIV